MAHERARLLATRYPGPSEFSRWLQNYLRELYWMHLGDFTVQAGATVVLTNAMNPGESVPLGVSIEIHAGSD